MSVVESFKMETVFKMESVFKTETTLKHPYEFLDTIFLTKNLVQLELLPIELHLSIDYSVVSKLKKIAGRTIFLC